MVGNCGFSYGHRRPKSFVALGDKSEHWLIANLAVRTGIAPSVLLQESDRMIYTMMMAIQAQNRQQ